MVLWSSQVVSTIGTRVSGIAYPLLVLAITGSPALAGAVGFAQTQPFLILYLPAGALVDRWDRRRVMLIAEAGRAIALGSVAITTLLGVVAVPQLVVVAFVEGALYVFFDLCEGAALPRLVATEQLPQAMAQNQARIQGADLIGQPLGGALFGLGRAFPFLFDAVSYLVSFVALLTIRVPLQAEDRPERRSIRSEVVEGLAAVWRQPFLRASVVIVSGQNFAWNALTLVMIVRARDLGAEPALIGVMFAFSGAGALLGAVLAPWVQSRVATRVIVVSIAWLWALQFVVQTVLADVIALGVAAGVGSIAGPIFNVAFGTVLYRVTPDRLLGRVRSVIKVVAWGAIPLGSLAAGLLAGGLGAQAAIAVLAGVMVAIALVTSFAGGVREIPDR